jgi:hypothetical protein
MGHTAGQGTSLIGGEQRVTRRGHCWFAERERGVTVWGHRWLAERGGWRAGVDTFYWRTVPPPTLTHRGLGTLSQRQKNWYSLYVRISQILTIIRFRYYTHKRPECWFLSAQFWFVVSFFCSKFCQKQKTSKCGNIEKYINIIYSVSFPKKH